MRVNDVDALSQPAHQRAPGPQVELRAAAEVQHLDPGGGELGVEQRLVGAPRGAEETLESLAVEPRRDLDGEALRPARDGRPVDQRDDAQLPHAASFAA